jgi:hypothetical protein
MKLALRLGAIALPLSLLTLYATDSRACGGCFHPEDQPPDQSSVVLAHRMALSISTDASVLWDQVQYTGSPAEFAWVLPVKPGARLELASDAWFEALDATTAVRVTAPTLQCVTRSQVVDEVAYVGCQVAAPLAATGCASEGAGAVRDTTEITELAPEQPPVTVVHQGSAGPYETVTLHSNEPGVLSEWLVAHGYAIGADIQPVLDGYADQGFDFIALRLAPNAGVQQMKPVRVIQPGAVTTLPLRMVAAGTGAKVSLTLFVIAEGRIAPQNFSTADRPAQLTWNFSFDGSDYASQRSQLLGDRTWLTAYAAPQALFAPAVDGQGKPVQYQTGLGPSETIADAFFDQAYSNGEASLSCAGYLDEIAQSGAKVANPCPPEGGECESVAPGDLDARYFECGPIDDLARALVGLHPRDVWVTRLEAELGRDFLATDLELAPAAQLPVSNLLVAGNYVSPPCEVAPAAVLGRGSGGRGRPGGPSGFLLLVSASLAALAIARRFGRARAPSFVGAQKMP